MKKSSILIVDDSPVNLQLVAATLKPHVNDVSFAQNGNEALNLLKEKTFTLILLDIMMPDISGIEVLKAFKKQRDHKNYETPVIFLTARDDEKTVEEAFEAGGVDYITKPFNHKELIKRIEIHIKLKRQTDQILNYNRRIKEDIKFAEFFQNMITGSQDYHNKYLKSSSLYIASEEIGGDYINQIESGGNLFLLGADVTGHGLKASLYAFILDSIFHSAVKISDDIHKVFEYIKEHISRYLIDEVFITTKLLKIDPLKKILEYFDAGHPPLVIVETASEITVKMIKNQSSFLTNFEALNVIDHGHIELKKGMKIILFSDGLIENVKEGVHYSEKEIENSFRELFEKNPQSGVKDILQQFKGTKTKYFDDDISFCLTEMNP